MANNPIDMRKVRKVLTMHFWGKSKSFISKYLNLSRNIYNSLLEIILRLFFFTGNIFRKKAFYLD